MNGFYAISEQQWAQSRVGPKHIDSANPVGNKRN